jgi:hypothetical protein
MTMEQQPKPVPTELEVDSLERAESTPPEEAMAELRLADASAGLLTAPSQHEEPAHSPSEPNVTQRLSTLWRSTNLQEWPQLLPLVKILVLLIVAGFGLKLTGAVLGSINDLPLLGSLVELVGLLSVVQFLFKNALQQQKLADLLTRIEQVKKDLLG